MNHDVPRAGADRGRDREEALARAEEVLGGFLRHEGLRVSPLGAAFSKDVDAYVHTMPPRVDLMRHGWLPLDGLLSRVGLQGEGCWAVTARGRVLGKVDLHVADPPDPVEHVLARCRREGAGSREFAELAALRIAGHDVPAVPPALSRRRAARVHVGRLTRGPRTALRPRVVVALSGVDGAGKSTMSELLEENLDRVGVPHGRVWVRPGSVSPVVDRAARLARTRLHLAPSEKSGFAAAARGRARQLRSRRGLIGRAWAALVVEEFARAVWRDHLRARGVVVYDRHERDAEVSFRLFYAAEHGSRAVSIVRRVLPRAAVDVYLDVPLQEALSRKPDDVVGEWAVGRQLEMYEELMSEPQVDPLRLDATRPAEQLALEVFTQLTRVEPVR